MRTFSMHRDEDVTGFSGTGVVAQGVLFEDGTVAIRWFGQHCSTVVWDTLTDAMVVHGHDGRTRFVFDDEEASDVG
jgi:hypothetical protein